MAAAGRLVLLAALLCAAHGGEQPPCVKRTKQAGRGDGEFKKVASAGGQRFGKPCGEQGGGGLRQMVLSAQLGQALQPEHDGQRGTRLVVQVALVARCFAVLTAWLAEPLPAGTRDKFELILVACRMFHHKNVRWLLATFDESLDNEET